MALPTASFLRADRCDQPNKRLQFSTALLNDAQVFASGVIRLADGTWLRDAIITHPTALPYKPSDLDERILRHVIVMTNSQARCSRGLRQGVFPRRLRKHIAITRGLDYSAVKGIERPPLKVIARYLRQHDSVLKNVPHQKISDALATFGICGRSAK